jgi:hypothetical protein
MRALGKKIQCLVLASTIAFACKNPDEQNGRQLPFVVIKSDSDARVTDQSVVRITNETELSAIWEQVYSSRTPLPPVPSMDFNKDMCLFIFLGSRPNSGYSMDLSQVLETDTSIRLRIRETVYNGPTAQVITSPYLIVTLAKNPKPIECVFTRFW